MAGALLCNDETSQPMARIIYRFTCDRRFDNGRLRRGLCGIAQREVVEHNASHLASPLDPRGFKRPCVENLEGVSTGMRSPHRG